MLEKFKRASICFRRSKFIRYQFRVPSRRITSPSERQSETYTYDLYNSRVQFNICLSHLRLADKVAKSMMRQPRQEWASDITSEGATQRSFSQLASVIECHQSQYAIPFQLVSRPDTQVLNQLTSRMPASGAGWKKGIQFFFVPCCTMNHKLALSVILEEY